MTLLIGSSLGILGAFLGALFGYAFGIYERKLELEAKRIELFNALRDELDLIDVQPLDYDVGKAAYRSPIHLIFIDRLLDGETLDYSKNKQLIRSLLVLQKYATRHDDFVVLFNLLQNLGTLPDTAHKSMHNDMVRRAKAVEIAKSEVISLLPD